MNSKLNHIENWTELVNEANWSASALAKKCGVSARTLERFFLKKMGKSPKAWLAEQRLHRAVELLRDGSSVKEVANLTGFLHASTFSREFKKHLNCCPTQFLTFKSAQLKRAKNAS